MNQDVALIFPGQGSQFVGMGREFYEQSPEAKAVFDKADTIIPGLTDVIFNGPEEKLTSTKYCQPAIFTVSVAALEAFKASKAYKAITPKFACGHSLGEYSALVACGAVHFSDALKLVERRSFFMEAATKERKGTMAAVIGFDLNKLIELCLECQVELANFNSLEQTVITGSEENMKDAVQLIQEHGAKRVVPLPVSGAFHSSLMASAAEKFKPELAKIHFHTPAFPIVHNVTALPASNPHDIQVHLAQQITSSVKWVETIQNIAGHGIKQFIEIGPGTVLKGLIRKIDRELSVSNIRTPDDI